MSIGIKKYVSITSGEGSGTLVPERNLVGRLFTASSLLPPQSYLQFSSAAEVGEYFGTSSEEYLRAVFYFAFISKSLVQPAFIQYARFAYGFTTTQTGTLTSTATTLTGLTSTAGILIGATITGTGIQANTTITAIVSDTALTLSQAATATGAQSLTITNTGVAAKVISAQEVVIPDPTTVWANISNGSFGITIGGVALVLTMISFSGVTTPQGVAAILQTAIRTGTGTAFTAATVTYGQSFTGGPNGFIITAGSAGTTQSPVTITIQPGVSGSTDISGINWTGWYPQSVYSSQATKSGVIQSPVGAIWSNGLGTETIAQCLTTSSSLSNNFGSFLFLTNLGLTLAQVQSAATWNAGENALYLYTIAVSAANASAWSAGLASTPGCSLTLQSPSDNIQNGTLVSGAFTITGLTSTAGLIVGQGVSGTSIPSGSVISVINSLTQVTISLAATASVTVPVTFAANEYPEQFPMMIEAATNFDAENGVQNYMFQIDNTGLLSPSVFTDANYELYTALNVNFYGQTQESGTQIEFYQQGIMVDDTGTSIPTMTTYVNEIWLKSAATSAIMSLLLSLNQLPANNQGNSQLLTILQGVVNRALLNGVISVGKPLTTVAQAYITQITGDPLAWYQVQNSGYWMNCLVQPIPDNLTQWEAVYTLVYSKDDTVNFVSGTHTLI